MVQRIMVAVIGVPLIFVILYACPPVVLAAVLSLLSALAIHEVLWTTGLVRHGRIVAYSMAAAALIPLWCFFEWSELAVLGGLLVYLTLLFGEAMASNMELRVEQLGCALLFTVMVPYFLGAMLRIRQMEELGIYYLLLPILIAFLSDAFALFAGRALGKHKLAPRLSPKKTVEGSVGGVLGAVVSCLVYGLILEQAFSLDVNYLFMAVYGFLGSLISQFGDLSFSYVKRQCGIKDFGKLLPGHGGVLDRFDSVIFCAPLTEFLILLLPAFAMGG